MLGRRNQWPTVIDTMYLIESLGCIMISTLLLQLEGFGLAALN
jgi:hypothetical protein